MADSQKNKKKTEFEDNFVDKIADKIVDEDEKIGKFSLNSIIKKLIAIVIIIVLVAIAYFIIKNTFFSVSKDVKELVVGEEGTVSSDSKVSIVSILQDNKLQTTKNNYSTILTVPCEEDKGEISYYVRYTGTLITGIDLSTFSEENINIDSEKNQIVITLPPTQVQSLDVEESSMEFIYIEADEDDHSIFTSAYKLCKEDLENKITSDENFMGQAKTNTESAISGLLQPLIDQHYPDYTVVFE